MSVLQQRLLLAAGAVMICFNMFSIQRQTAALCVDSVRSLLRCWLSLIKNNPNNSTSEAAKSFTHCQASKTEEKRCEIKEASKLKSLSAIQCVSTNEFVRLNTPAISRMRIHCHVMSVWQFFQTIIHTGIQTASRGLPGLATLASNQC